MADDGEGRPVLITMEQVEDRGGERWFYVDADVRAGHTRKPRPADLLAEGVVSFSFPSMGGTFQLRRVDGRHAVRWIPAE